MTEKILFWIDSQFLLFGIAKYIQKLHDDCELYLIADCDEKLKKFFKKQDIVNFKKIYFFRDETSNIQKKPDIEFLENFEKQYNINLWLVAYGERVFLPLFNPYYQYNKNEILSILEQECKFFKKVL